MFLKRLYSEPEGLFEEIVFKDGMNIIFGHKDSDGSLNGIGKSTALDLIDFCLLASYKSNSNSRVYAARKILTKHDVVLEFEVNSVDYVIKRSVDDSKDIVFGCIGEKLQEYKLSEATRILSDLVFFNESYEGYYSDKWWRALMPLFLRIHKHNKKDKFADPIEYNEDKKLSELIQYHFFLLGINNKLVARNYLLQAELKRREPAIKELKRLMQETYGVSDVKDLNSSQLKLEREISKLEISLEKFQLADNYQDAELKANEITEKIKKIWLLNIDDRKKIDDYTRSFILDDTFTTYDKTKVAKIYKQTNEQLGIAIKRTLDQAIAFRKQLAESRKEFISKEIDRLNDNIKKRSQALNALEGERSEILGFLRAKEAIKDLTGAFMSLSEKRKDLADIRSKVGAYNDLEIERLQLNQEETRGDIEIKQFIDGIQPTDVRSISDVFLDVYTAIYGNAEGAVFSIAESLTKDAKVEIKVNVPKKYSKGRNQGRTLIYDLTLVLNMIKNNIPGPRFIIHDGIFDGMDKEHFIKLYEFVESQKHTSRMQYIATLNEEGDLKENFGVNHEILDTDRLLDEAILVLTPTKKLLGEFDE